MNLAQDKIIPVDISSITSHFQNVRKTSEWQCEPLITEDYGL